MSRNANQRNGTCRSIYWAKLGEIFCQLQSLTNAWSIELFDNESAEVLFDSLIHQNWQIESNDRTTLVDFSTQQSLNIRVDLMEIRSIWHFIKSQWPWITCLVTSILAELGQLLLQLWISTVNRDKIKAICIVKNSIFLTFNSVNHWRQLFKDQTHTHTQSHSFSLWDNVKMINIKKKKKTADIDHPSTRRYEFFYIIQNEQTYSYWHCVDINFIWFNSKYSDSISLF